MKKASLILTSIAFIILLASGCHPKPKTLFRLLPPDQTGVDFTNTIQQTDSFNIFTYEYLYNGGGVAVADFNNDGLQDLFFSGNQVPNKLYLNKGHLAFKDVTEKANVNVPGRWNSGIAAIDINNDGWMDLYVCATTRQQPEKRRNMLFVNQGVDASGEPTFKEMAAQYKVDFNGHSVMAAFLDYDHDGDLDLYILVNERLKSNTPAAFHPKITDGSAPNNDRLLRNDGNGSFTDVTIESGITYEGFGLGLAIADFNNDGWPDIYVSNDYLSNDILYINEKNGSFKNRTAEFLGHESQFSMGNDAADINNDGRSDIITLDMLPEINERKKTTIGNKTYQTYINNETYHYEYQYVRNMLQLNNGLEKGIKFSEIGQLSGVYQTEWSWSPLFADFDNDGFKDLAITNGFPKDITDKDFANYRAAVMNISTPTMMSDSLPVVKIPNYAFRNNGDLTFSDVSAAWGLNESSFSNGAAFADLDNDGDLDYVVNNINSPAFVYENLLYTPDKKDNTGPAYLRIKLKGPATNPDGLGTKVTLFYDHGKMQYLDHSIYRGYLSSVENVLHFGLGKNTTIDSIRILWPDGTSQKLMNVVVNKTITINRADATDRAVPTTTMKKIFKPASAAIPYKQAQADVIDFNFQRTLPHKYSQYGPSLAVGDVNGDHLDDFFVGGASGIGGTIFLQQRDGTFKPGQAMTGGKEKASEDMGALLFDADGDNDLDLVVVSGGFEFEKDSKKYEPHFYRNSGNGNFAEDKKALPEMTTSGSCVRAADFDGDGDLDLFVGGRVIPWQYPYTPESYILQNEHGVFRDATDKICPELKKAGMITDAVWSDFDNDGKVDLVVTGELMAISFFKNKGSFLTGIASGIGEFKGWWNSIAAGDFDGDGDIDYITGNLGKDNFYHVSKEQPLKVFAKDFDGNGSVDAITACYFKMADGSMQLCPVHFWDELNSQSPRFRRQFTKFKHYGRATMEKLLSPKDLEGAVILEANYSASSYVENLGGGKFKLTPLPVEAQFAPVFGIAPYDYDHDGNLDVLLVGNDYGNEVFSGRYDAMTGLVLKGDGHGGFTSVAPSESGFYVPGDAKALVRIQGKDGQDMFIASQNKDSLKVYIPAVAVPRGQVVALRPGDAYAEFTLLSGAKRRIEFYYGAGFLSQSTRTFQVPEGVSEVVIYDFKGTSRKAVPGKAKA
jgi:hypothetical protein